LGPKTRAGGHGFFSSAQVVVDMREGFGYTTMNIDFDHGNDATATIGMGQTLGKIDEITHPYHVPFGVVSHTGTGLLLTGGCGYLTKAHGLSADNIVEVTIVLSDGTIHTCSKEKEPDLFFAVRGAAPNLGIVTQVKAKCYKVPDAFGALLAWPLTLETLTRVFKWCDQDAVLNDPNITPYVGMIPSPDMSAHLCCIHVVCVGPPKEDAKYEALLGQLIAGGKEEEGDATCTQLLPASRVPWSTPQTIFDESFPNQFWYASQSYFPGDVSPSPACVKAAVEAYLQLSLHNHTAPFCLFEQRGSLHTSAFHDNKNTDNAQPTFDQRYEVFLFFGTPDKDKTEEMLATARQFKQVLIQGGATAGGRVHFTKDEPSRIDYYYGPNSDRVRKVVAKYDPHRLFASCNGMEF
jgi:FAD/FMN-containing dehydrogenase